LNPKLKPLPAASNAAKKKAFSEIFVFYYNLVIAVEKHGLILRN
jgi:hypothetical protein